MSGLEQQFVQEVFASNWTAPPEPQVEIGYNYRTVDTQAFGATREDIRLALEAENIESRPLWKPMHLQPVFQGCEVVTHPRPLPTKEGSSVAEALFRDGLCLPSGTAMTQAEIERVAAVVRDTGHR